MDESVQRNAVALAGLRISVGALFVMFGGYKVFGTQFTLGGGFEHWIHMFLEQGAYPFMAPVLRVSSSRTRPRSLSLSPTANWPSAWPW